MTTRLPLHLEGLSKSALEGMCIDCGLCCTAAVPIAKGVNAFVPELRCKFLVQKGDGKTCCSTYETRFEKAAGWCLPLPDAIFQGVLPEQCPYVSNMDGYVGKVALDDAAYSMLAPLLRKHLVPAGRPDWADQAGWDEFAGGDT